MRKTWTDAEIEYLKENYAGQDTNEIAKQLERSKASVSQKATRLGFSKNTGWTEDDDIYLAYFVYENDTDLGEAATFLNRSRKAVIVRLKNLRKMDDSVGYIRRKWTEKEDEFLRKNYKIMSNRSLAESLRRTSAAVCGRKKYLGLKRIREISIHREKIIEMAANGYYRSEIAREIDADVMSLNRFLRDNNIYCKMVPYSERSRSWRR